MASRNPFPELELKTRRFWLFLGWMLVLLVIYLSVTSAPIEIPVEHGDKLSHVLAYFALMSWFANLYESSAERTMFAIGFIVMGIALEFVQRWIEFRSFEVTDMVAGAVGVAGGWILAPPRLPNYLHMLEKLCRT